MSSTARALLLLVVLVPLAAFSQNSKPVDTPGFYTDAYHTGANNYSFWAGTSANTPNRIGVTTDRRLTMVAFQYGRVIWGGHRASWIYTIDAIPLAALAQPTVFGLEYDGFKSDFIGPLPPSSAFGRRTSYAAGVNPLGSQVNFLSRRRVQPFVNTTAGLLYFNRDAPVPHSSRFNFTFSAGGGVEVFTSPSRSISFGARFHHLSNDETGTFNPGVDSTFFYAQYAFHK